MEDTKGVVKRWRILVALYAILTTGVTLFYAWLTLDSQSPDAVDVGIVVVFAVISALLWVSVHQSGKDNPTLAGTLSIIGGVLTLPAGALLILAGTRMRAAANANFQQWLDSQKRGTLGIGD